MQQLVPSFQTTHKFFSMKDIAIENLKWPTKCGNLQEANLYFLATQLVPKKSFFICGNCFFVNGFCLKEAVCLISSKFFVKDQFKVLSMCKISMRVAEFFNAKKILGTRGVFR